MCSRARLRHPFCLQACHRRGIPPSHTLHARLLPRRREPPARHRRAQPLARPWRSPGACLGWRCPEERRRGCSGPWSAVSESRGGRGRCQGGCGQRAPTERPRPGALEAAVLSLLTVRRISSVTRSMRSTSTACGEGAGGEGAEWGSAGAGFGGGLGGATAAAAAAIAASRASSARAPAHQAVRQLPVLAVGLKGGVGQRGLPSGGLRRVGPLGHTKGLVRHGWRWRGCLPKGGEVVRSLRAGGSGAACKLGGRTGEEGQRRAEWREAV